jgi:VWFA-related protein
MNRISIRFVASIAVISLIEFGAAFSIPIEQLQHEVSVVLKLIPVRVTDRKGEPIAGLKKEDFALFVDGEKTTITDFEEHLLPPSLKIAKQPPSPPAAKSAAKNLLNRKFVFFFDFAFNSARGIPLSKDAALKFLKEKVEPDDQIALISYSATRGLRVHEFFSNDHEKIKEAIESFGFSDIVGRAEDIEQQYLEFLRSEDENGTRIAGMESLEVKPSDLFSRRVAQGQILDYLDRLNELALALRYIPGDKYWLYFSSGPPSSLVFVDPRSIFLSTQARSEYENLIKELSASNCVLFPFDAHDFGGPEAQASGAYTLERMAKQTGGRFYGNIGSPKNLDDIQNRTEAYYVLGFPIHEASQSGFHDVKVSVNKPGCRVNAPAGFFDSKPFKKMSPFERALHLVDVALSEAPLSQIPLTMPMRGYYWPFPKGSNVLLAAELPMTAIQAANFKEVEIVDIITDSNKRVVLLQGGQADIGSFNDSPAIYWSIRSLPHGTYDYRTVVRDLETGRAVIGSGKIAIVDDGKPIQFFPPVFMRPSDPSMLGPRACSFLAASGKRVETRSAGPFESFLPKTSGFRPLFGVPPETVDKLFVIFPYKTREPLNAEFRAVYWNVNADATLSEPRALRVELRNGDSGGFVCFEIPVADLRGGKQIRLRFEDAVSGFSFSSRIGLTASPHR